MIELYSGTPGSGKSLHATEKIKNWLELYKAPVLANFEFKAGACKERGYGSYLYVPNNKLNPELLIRFSEEYKRRRRWKQVPEEHILLIIDECQLLFNAREWNKPHMKPWISFFTQHRKLGYRVILIAQFDRMIDRQVRSVIEYEYMHRKVKNIGKAGLFLNIISGGSLHVCVKIYKPLNLKVGSEWFRSDKNLISLYNSYTRFNDNGKADSRGGV